MNQQTAFLFIAVGLVVVGFTFLPEVKDSNISFESSAASNVRPLLHQDYYSGEIKLQEVQQLAYDNTIGKEYILHKFDCTQFSEDLVSTLKSKGYKAQCTAGNNWNFEYTNHTWVSVWIDGLRFEIESTNGEILTDEQYSTYEVKWEDRCW